MEKFRSFIAHYADITSADWSRIRSVITREEYRQGDAILRVGEICHYLFFLETGLLRYFIVDRDGNEATKFFTEAPFVFTSQKSFTTRKPSDETIECLEDCSVWLMTYADANKLLEIRGWSDFIRKLIQEVQNYTEEILLEIQTTSAEDRYRKMVSEPDNLIHKVPLRHIASYLGIKPQSLSRIRKQLAANDSKLT